MKRVIVPFFISHQGCPHHCLFCDQRSISGSSGELPAADAMLAKIGDWQATANGAPLEVAFYGGTFTALPRSAQEALLQPLQPLLAAGRIAGIRVSTRPDAVDVATADFLREAGVNLVELGIQSMHGRTLVAAGRGHGPEATEQAFARLQAAGLAVGAQLMPGLPGEAPADSLASFRRVLALGPATLRIYPALVLRGTGLEQLYLAGEYQPLSLMETIDLVKVMLHEAALAGIPVIRVGLQPTEDLTPGAAVVAGPVHPALRQLAESARWYDLLLAAFAAFPAAASLELHCHPARLADLVGQGRSNVTSLARTTGRTIRGVTGNQALPDSAIRIDDGCRTVTVDLLQDLDYSNQHHRGFN